MKTRNMLFAAALTLSTAMVPAASVLNSMPVYATADTEFDSSTEPSTPKTKVINETGHAYAAYQIFTGEEKPNDPSLYVTGWGNGINESALHGALEGSSTFQPYAIDWTNSANNIANFLNRNENISDNSPAVLEFARIVSENLGTPFAIIDADGGLSDINENSISSLAPGYYLLVDQHTGSENEKMIFMAFPFCRLPAEVIFESLQKMLYRQSNIRCRMKSMTSTMMSLQKSISIQRITRLVKNSTLN